MWKFCEVFHGLEIFFSLIFKSATCRMGLMAKTHNAGMCLSDNRSEIAQMAERPTSSGKISASIPGLVKISLCRFKNYLVFYSYCDKFLRWWFQDKFIKYHIRYFGLQCSVYGAFKCSINYFVIARKFMKEPLFILVTGKF